MRGVTERCFFDRRRGCSSGSRGSASLQQCQFWMKDKQSYAEESIKRASCERCLRQATKKQQRRDTLGSNKPQKKPPRATPSHPKATASHFSVNETTRYRHVAIGQGLDTRRLRSTTCAKSLRSATTLPLHRAHLRSRTL